MAWDTLKVHTDPENGTTVTKQIRRRPHHGTELRFIFRTKNNRIFNFTTSEMFDLTDTFNDVCELVETKKF